MSLDALDEALVGVRLVLQRPSYRRRLMARLGDATLGTLRIVRAVQRAGEVPPSVGDVAERLAIDPSTASRSVDDAVERGYVVRKVCRSDRRRARLHLTGDGTELLDRMTDVRRELLSEVTADWAPDEVEHLVGSLRRLLDGFEALGEAP